MQMKTKSLWGLWNFGRETVVQPALCWLVFANYTNQRRGATTEYQTACKHI